MNLKFLPLLLCATGIAFGQVDANSSPDINAKPPENLKPETGAPPMLGIHWARDFDPTIALTVAEIQRRNRQEGVLPPTLQ